MKINALEQIFAQLISTCYLNLL